MDRAEQLADYLAGTLTPEEHAALSAELARDADLRAQHEAMRAGDRALDQLSSPTPPTGFEERLDAALADELASILGGSEPAPGAERRAHAPDSSDELAARRAGRQRTDAGWPRWVTAVSGAAAALIVLAGAGVVFSGMLGSGDDAAVTTESMDTDDGGMESAEDQATLQAAPDEGPLLRATDRDLDEDAALAMLDDAEAFAFADRNLDEAGTRELATTYAQALGAAPRAAADDGAAEAEADTADEGAADQDTAQEDAGDAEALQGPTDAGAPLRMDPEISEEQRIHVGRCLETLLGDEAGIVPVYAELTSFEGDPVILFGFVTEDPETDLFTRREVWIVDRDTCQVRLFLQD